MSVYNPKAFIPHAASLRQTFVHCAKFPAAATRRCGGRVAVPLWLIVLSDQLPVIDLVGHYPTNYLIGRRLIPKRLAPLPRIAAGHIEYYSTFRRTILNFGVDSYVLLSRLPLILRSSCERSRTVRLACLKHAASVYPELGSNSQIYYRYSTLPKRFTWSYPP